MSPWQPLSELSLVFSTVLVQSECWSAVLIWKCSSPSRMKGGTIPRDEEECMTEALLGAAGEMLLVETAGAVVLSPVWGLEVCHGRLLLQPWRSRGAVVPPRSMGGSSFPPMVCLRGTTDHLCLWCVLRKCDEISQPVFQVLCVCF